MCTAINLAAKQGAPDAMLSFILTILGVGIGDAELTTFYSWMMLDKASLRRSYLKPSTIMLPVSHPLGQSAKNKIILGKSTFLQKTVGGDYFLGEKKLNAQVV